MANLIGLDIGTTGCKAVVFSEDGRVSGSAYREYGIDTDGAGKAEQDPELVWRLCREVLAKAVAGSTEKVGKVPDVVALGLSVQGDAIIPLDGNGKPVHPALLGMDYRSAPQAAACEARFGGEALFKRTGMRPHAINSLCKVLWLRESRPDLWARTARVVTYADFISDRLLGGGKGWFIDLTMASRTMAWNLAAGDWDDGLLGELGLSRSLFSDAVPSGTELGILDADLARAFGLAGQVSLVAGGHDQPCGAVGAAVLKDGDAVVSSGTAEVLSTTFSSRADPSSLYSGYYPCYQSALPDRRFTFALNHVGGLLLRWYRDTWCAAESAEALKTGRDAYALIDEGMPAGPSPVMFLPHLNGAGTPSCDPFSRGAVVGLTLATTRGDVAKAILECLAFELALNVEALSAAGVRIDRLSAVGGGAKSPVWLAIKADILGVPIRTLECKEAACLGAAIIAGTGSGVYTSIAEGIRRAVRFEAVYEPDSVSAAAYAERYAVYRNLYGALKPIYERMRFN